MLHFRRLLNDCVQYAGFLFMTWMIYRSGHPMGAAIFGLVASLLVAFNE